jgi:glycosyltransferase involved in cell wall biosynthesis
MGKVPHDEMPDLLSRTDIYVSTSLSDGTSVSLLEAMACGAFPVVTDIPANREWIEDGNNGLLVPTEDEVSLAKRILEAMNQRELVASACQKNREIVEKRAHLKNQVEDLFHIYSNHLK